MQPKLVSARRILFELIAPLLKPLFERLRASHIDGEDDFLKHVFDELRHNVGSDVAPRLWTVHMDEHSAPAVHRVMEDSGAVTLREIFRNPTDRENRIACVDLVIRRGEAIRVMPDLDYPLGNGDQLLRCGREKDLNLLEATTNNEYTLKYLISGADEPRGYLMQWVTRRLNGHQPMVM